MLPQQCINAPIWLTFAACDCCSFINRPPSPQGPESIFPPYFQRVCQAESYPAVSHLLLKNDVNDQKMGQKLQPFWVINSLLLGGASWLSAIVLKTIEFSVQSAFSRPHCCENLYLPLELLVGFNGSCSGNISVSEVWEVSACTLPDLGCKSWGKAGGCCMWWGIFLRMDQRYVGVRACAPTSWLRFMCCFSSFQFFF